MPSVYMFCVHGIWCYFNAVLTSKNAVFMGHNMFSAELYVSVQYYRFNGCFCAFSNYVIMQLNIVTLAD